ncbi:MAG: NAD(P)/FAD-dependent oxidoreductase [Gammaproteobacteria bacterium]|nr:NAD(P)/FAD-dependent oxidoreductase [Gammaproteobacteria bacterium]
MPSDRRTVVAVVGGGFAGVALTRRLERDAGVRVRLLSEENYVTYNPLLGEVVGASILPGHVVAPVRQMIRRAEFHMVRVTGVDLKARRLHYEGMRRGTLSYDALVLACGVRANLDLVPGMAEHAFPLKTLGDALHLRNRVLDRLEHAEMEPDAARRRRLVTFVVVGGGFSGVEVAGEINDFVRAASRYYPRIDASGCKVTLIHSRDRLLGEISPGLGHYALRKMRRAGVEVCLNARVALVHEAGVELVSGTSISAGTVICTIGTAPHPLIEQLPLPKQGGAVETRPDMSVPGHPGVWALGDCAAVTNAHDGKSAPPTAQLAVREAAQLAENLRRSIRGLPVRPFRHRSRGQLASIGHNKAVAQVFGLRLSGFPAWLLWRGFYLLKIPTLARKVRIFIEWNWEMLFPPDIVHLRFTRTRRGGDPRT